MSQPLPFSRLAERQALAYALGELSWVSYLALHASEADFHHPPHRDLFAALSDLEGRAGCDLDAVQQALAGRGLNGWTISDLGELGDDMPPCEADAQRAVERLRALRRVRRLMAAAKEVEEQGRLRAGDVDAYVAWAEGVLYHALHATEDAPTIRHIGAEVSATLQELETAVERGDELLGVPTDFAALDRITGGWRPGTLTIVAARPAMGKSALAGAFVWRAGRADVPTLFSSLEMGRAELVRRMIAAKVGINVADLTAARVERWQWSRIYEAAERLGSAPVWLCEDPRMTVEQLASLARLQRARRGLGLLVVDYLQLLRTARKHHTREREVADVSSQLKALAKELAVPVIALSQLNRALEGRQDKRPNLGDLRDSGAIEQDADLVLFLYRDEVYDPSTRDRGIAEVRIAKQRNGPTGTARLAWVAEFTRFEDLEEQHGS